MENGSDTSQPEPYYSNQIIRMAKLTAGLRYGLKTEVSNFRDNIKMILGMANGLYITTMGLLNTNWNTWQELQKTVRWILINLTF
jgi:hypothetical protein